MSANLEIIGMAEWLMTIRKMKDEDANFAATTALKTANVARTEWQKNIRTVNVGGFVGVMDTKKYLDSISIEPESADPSGIVLNVRAVGVPYAVYIEYGYSPHWCFPPSSALEKWAQRKILGFGVKGGTRFSSSPTKKASQLSLIKSVAYLVARKIWEKGMSAHPCFEPAGDVAGKYLETQVKDWGQKAI